MGQYLLCPVWLVAGALALVVLSGPAALASTVRPASIVTVSLTVVRLHVPLDGRINGDGFTAQVTGYRFGEVLGAGGSAVRAKKGQELLVFGLNASTRALAASLVVDGHREPLPHTSGTAPFVTVYYLASVPQRAKGVGLELSRDGFTQEFSFTHGRREGPQPSVLYATATGWEVSLDLPGEADLSVLGPRGGVLETATQVLNISASLTYFLPSTHATPGGPREAWLVVRGGTFPFYTSASQGLPDLAYTRPLRGSDLVLTMPGSKPTVAKVTASSPASHGALFDGDYYWRVPASIELGAAVLHITMPPLIAMDASGAPVKFQARLSAAPVVLDFPAPSAPPPPPAGNPPPYLRALPTSPTASARPGAPLLVLLGCLIAVALIGVVVVVSTKKRGLSRLWALGSSQSHGNQGPRPGPFAHVPAGPSDIAEGQAPLAVGDPDQLQLRAPEADFPSQRPSPADVLPPLPEGALLRIVGQVRLDRVPEPPETPPETPWAPELGARHPSGPTSAPGGPTSPGPEPTSVPTGPPPLPTGDKELQVLGQPRLFAEPGGVVDLDPRELELLARLALGPEREFSGEELRADLAAAKETDWAASTLWSRVSSLRKAIGAEHLPSSSRTRGYRAVGIGTDVARFESAIARAKADPDGAIAHLAEALSLLRGVPFANVPTGTFTWALEAGGFATRLTNEAYSAAVELAQAAIAAHMPALAGWAIGKARLIVRDDDVLLEKLELDAAAASPENSALARSWATLKARYRAKGKKVPRSLVDYYRRLQRGSGS